MNNALLVYLFILLFSILVVMCFCDLEIGVFEMK